ncbi:hypothetical protein Plhal703r1_c14g0069791 [Plasmopara halstedii]
MNNGWKIRRLSWKLLSVAESVDLETDDCMDEGLLDGCLSASAAVGLMDAMKKAMSETRKHVASFRKIVTFSTRAQKEKPS